MGSFLCQKKQPLLLFSWNSFPLTCKVMHYTAHVLHVICTVPKSPQSWLYPGHMCAVQRAVLCCKCYGYLKRQSLGMPCMQCKVLYVGNCRNPSLGYFAEVRCSTIGFLSTMMELTIPLSCASARPLELGLSLA